MMSSKNLSLTAAASPSPFHRRPARHNASKGLYPDGCAAQQIHHEARISLCVNYHCEWGQQVVLVGSSQRLGNWQADDGLEMQWNEGDVWTIDLDLPLENGIDMEYKYVIRGPDGHITWKPGSNYNIALPGEDSANWLQIAVAIRDAWDGASRCIEIDHHESERISMEQALNKLDAMVNEAMTIETGPGAPERLAADLEVAAAAKQALEILRLVQAKEAPNILPHRQEE
ncbi:hypothetical protein CVIRNUC_007443 [Coccomyxa viridis]|uniref:CBM20 domain-containing protein n=1 Tax=Coccomyxa viridis TaxID=1274662 RepID=A0AAV1IAY4_9CHLO|nr:hypothetical protein CVIRNUC_007443 [Coccomyxa viridis]